MNMPDQAFPEGIERMISQMTAGVANTNLYSPAHPQVGQYIEKAYIALTDMLGKKTEITLLLIGDDLIVDSKKLDSTGNGSFVSSFTRILRKKAIERLTFLAGMPRSELQAFIIDLASGDPSIRSRPYIRLGKIEVRIKSGDPAVNHALDLPSSEVSNDALQELLSITASELDELKEIYLRIKKYRKIDVRGIDELVAGFIKGFRQEINPLTLLASLKSVNEYTFTHVSNVCILTMSQAETLGFTGEHLHQIGVASLLHDVGKIFVPEDILNKPGKLSDEERKVIETHTVKGARFLLGVEGIPKLAVLTAMEHHLKYDGTGYPSIRGGWEPNIASQMITVADVFDAMRSKRTYQEAFSLDKIVEVLNKGKGKSFNPLLVDHFIRLIRYQSK